jgi:hypothetical protein
MPANPPCPLDPTTSSSALAAAAREHQVFELVVDWPRWSAAPTAT